MGEGAAVAQWIVLEAHGQCMWIRIPSGLLVVSGIASDHNCSCAPKTNHSQDPLRKKPNSGFLSGYGDFKRT